MHYHCEVWIPNNQNVEEEVRDAMDPYYVGNEGRGFWDWYQIGGRWKGTHIPGYNPEEDPEHMLTCRYCEGTGLRDDMGHWEGRKKIFNDKRAEEMNGCNVCHGNGVEITWPTEWGPHPQDIIPISKAPDDLTCATLILPGEVLRQEVMELAGRKVKDMLKELGVIDGYLVTVDYHY